jgi:phage gp45-like
MHDQVRGNGSRVQILTTADGGTEQYHEITGMAGEHFQKVLAVRQHGFSSHPPNGSHAIAVALNGRRDLCVLLGGESAGRPVDLAEGASEVYDTAGSHMLMDAAGNITVTAPISITLVVGTAQIVITDGVIAITAPGGILLDAPSTIVKGNLAVGTGATGKFTTPTGRMVTVQDGIITNIF